MHLGESRSWPKYLSACHVGDPDGILGSCLLPGIALAVVAISGVNYQMEDWKISLSLFLCNSALNE